MCQPIATSSICAAAVPKSRATHSCMKGRTRRRSEKPEGAEGAGEVEEEGSASTGIRSRIVDALDSCAMTVLHAIYEDTHLLVLDKAAGLLCVPGRGDDKQDC